jgi:hypothetical protein
MKSFFIIKELLTNKKEWIFKNRLKSQIELNAWDCFCRKIIHFFAGFFKIYPQKRFCELLLCYYFEDRNNSWLFKEEIVDVFIKNAMKLFVSQFILFHYAKGKHFKLFFVKRPIFELFIGVFLK